MRRPQLPLALCLGSLALIAALAPAPQEIVKVRVGVGKLKDLAESRAKVCERMLDYYRESLKAPPAPGDPVSSPAERYAAGYEPIQLWSSRLVEARLDAALDLDARVAILASEVERINKFATELKEIAKNEPEWRVVSDRVEFYRLEAEYRLVKEKGGR
jgi:hypothetical protein